MRAVINTFAKEENAIYNGLTFPVVGHCNGHLEINIDGLICDFELTHVSIVDIQTEFFHAHLRAEKMGFDYWYNLLVSYIKANKIKIQHQKAPEKLQMQKQESADISEYFVTDEELFLHERIDINEPSQSLFERAEL